MLCRNIYLPRGIVGRIGSSMYTQTLGTGAVEYQLRMGVEYNLSRAKLRLFRE